MQKSDLLRLRHMLDVAKETTSFIRGQQRASLDRDRKLVLAIIKSIEIIGDLIQPTRTLQSSEKSPGSLSVFSDPSGLDVFLDKSNIGKTSIHAVEVTPSTNNLRVKDSENEIHA